MNIIKIFAVVSLIIFVSCSNQSYQNPDKINSNSAKFINNVRSNSNILKVNICELISPELLAEKIGGSVLKQPQHSDYGTTQGCEYEIDPPGADNYEYCAIWFYPASLFENSESALENVTGLNQKATVENLTGYGDESYVIHNESEKQSIVHVLLRGRLYIEVKAEYFDDAKRITELVLSKL